MGFFDWLNPPSGMSVDQQVPETPVLPQQESFPAPEVWLANKQAQEQAENEYRARQQTPETLPVEMQIPQTPTPVQENAPFPSPEEWLRQKEAKEQGITWDDSADVLTDVGKKLAQPAATALEAISYLDKPRGAIAGTVKAIQDDTPILEGAQKGWNENTSWKETFNPEWVKENPKTAAVAGLAADIAADPLWLLTPAKLASLAAKGSKAIGLTEHILNPAVNAVKNSETGQKAIEAVQEAFHINNPLQSAQEAYNATKASLLGDVKPVINYVEDTISKELPKANRQEVEAITQRLVESYPDIGKFARSGDEVAARDATIEALRSEISKAQEGLNSAKINAGKVGVLSEEEQQVANILKNNNLNANMLNDAVNAAQNMGEVASKSAKMAGPIDNNIRLKKAAIDLILAGKFPESRLSELSGFFSKEELQRLMPSLERQHKNSQALADIKQGMSMPGELTVKPVSKLEQEGINTAGLVDNGVNLNPNLKANLPNINPSLKLPNLIDETAATSEKVLPNISIKNRPPNNINLSNITEDERRLLTSIKSVPELSLKIKTNQELQHQVNALNRAKEALQKADISPEKTTQVIDSALKAGYTPAQVEGMFKISERMREVNQSMTNEAVRRGLITIDEVGAFSGGRHLRRMYTALENPEQHYNNLLKTGHKELADKFWAEYSKLESGFKAKGISLNTATFEERKNLSKAVQDQLGRLYEATYPFAKGNKIAAEQFAKYDFLKEVSNKYGSDVMQKGYKKVPITQEGKFGQLEGKFLPERVYNNVLFSVAKHDQEVTAWQKGVQRWKAVKLTNPASISRNFMSGAVMANVFGDVAAHKMPKIFIDTFADLKKGTPRYLEARNAGLFEANLSKGDLDIIANRTRGGDQTLTDKVDNVLQRGMNIYSVPDSFWRMAVYNNARDSGKTTQEAVRLANQALFDYSNAPRWIESLSRSGVVPFAKFPFFAAKQTISALYNNPAKVTKFTKPQNQNDSEDKQKIMPDYMKAKTLLPLGSSERTVNGKPQTVQNNLDLSYILPFASDVNLGNPLTDALILAATGQNKIGQKLIKPGDSPKQQVKAWTDFIYNSLGPSAPVPGNYAWNKLKDGIEGNVDAKGRQYDLPSAASQVFLGLKNVPINNKEVYEQKTKSIEFEMKNVKAEMNALAKDKDKRIKTEQKAELMRDYAKQYSELQKQRKEADQAYKRLKEKGAL